MTIAGKTLLAAVAATLLLAGCAARSPLSARNGVPADKYLIGGGFKVEWTAPTDGTFIVAEQNTGKVLVTESAQKGDGVDFSVGGDDDLATLERMVGLSLKDIRIRAYWIPAPSKLKPTNK